MGDAQDHIWVDSMPEAYEVGLVPTLFAPYAAELAARAATHEPRRVLEIAAGTGILTRALVAAVPHADITATDLNPAMVDAGRSRAPGATWTQADAQQLPFPDDHVDLAVCQFGAMFFPDKPAAFAEVRRVLQPDGVWLFSTWDTVETNDWAVALSAGLARALPDDPPNFVSAIPHGYHDADAVTADLAAGGLEVVALERVTLDGPAERAADVARGFCTGTPLRPAIEARADLEEVVAVVTDEMEARFGTGPATAQLQALVIEARPAR